MIYIYDILLNWTNNLKLREFYEWQINDDLEHIKKIPLVKVKDNLIKDLLTSKIKIETSFLSKIKDKTEGYFKSDIDIVDYAAIVFNDKKAIALELDNNGVVCYKSAMLIDEEEEVLSMGESLTPLELDYEVLKTDKNINYFTRKEEHEVKFLEKELRRIKKNKEEAKLNYLYKEFFQDDAATFDLKLTALEKELKKEYNTFHSKLFALLRLSTSKIKKNNESTTF